MREGEIELGYCECLHPVISFLSQEPVVVWALGVIKKKKKNEKTALELCTVQSPKGRRWWLWGHFHVYLDINSPITNWTLPKHTPPCTLLITLKCCVRLEHWCKGYWKYKPKCLALSGKAILYKLGRAPLPTTPFPTNTNTHRHAHTHTHIHSMSSSLLRVPCVVFLSEPEHSLVSLISANIDKMQRVYLLLSKALKCIYVY